MGFECGVEGAELGVYWRDWMGMVWEGGSLGGGNKWESSLEIGGVG